MYYRSTEKSALLIGDNFNIENNALAALGSMGLQIRYSKSGYEGLAELYREQPEVVLIDDSINDIPYVELCRQIRQSEQHSSVPLICVLKSDPSFLEMLDAYRCGADDCFTGESSTTQLVAKIEWLIVRKQSADSLRQYYSELRNRQSQTLGIVRATAELMDSIDVEYRTHEVGFANRPPQLVEERLEMGLGMIRSLASILEQQIDCFDISALIEQTGSPNQNNYRHRRYETSMELGS
jgi:DNA-binding response OmpR family regulator